MNLKNKIKKIVCNICSYIIPIDKKRIIFESLNDFDCNSGALFDYIIENNYNNIYRIYWIVKNKEYINSNLPNNVKIIDYSKKSILEKLAIFRAQYLIYDNVPISKLNTKQISIYLNHGIPIKNVKGIINVPENTDYVVCSSEFVKDHIVSQFSINDRTSIIYNGYPRNDYIRMKSDELKKLTSKKYDKVIIWMPTFRKAKGQNRNDSAKQFKFGLPIINTDSEYNKLNDTLKAKNILLIIKIHGGQDLSEMFLEEKSNIKILTFITEKEKNINLYKLLGSTDALITDYSSVSFDYLLTNNPIGYTTDDIDEYKLGFAFENVDEMLPGEKIKDFEGLLKFVEIVKENKDVHKKERVKVLNKLNDYQTIDNRKRLFEIIFKSDIIKNKRDIYEDK